ncbi:hypothetical protein AVEN_37725-1 [Araneus ventricosus]|uniref:Uncharacterized protein n=1 Tax=Araneus ventricosus TaxID=182803 RepID=A0A4Y2BU64_ARAVE|nr:hypothetical protein AVEN_37725-1 [Araneus ventricosus]
MKPQELFRKESQSLDQEDYIVKTFQYDRLYPALMKVKSTLADFVNGEPFEGPFRELIDSLLYLTLTTRHDILLSLSQPASGKIYCCCLDGVEVFRRY